MWGSLFDDDDNNANSQGSTTASTRDTTTNNSNSLWGNLDLSDDGDNTESVFGNITSTDTKPALSIFDSYGKSDNAESLFPSLFDSNGTTSTKNNTNNVDSIFGGPSSRSNNNNNNNNDSLFPSLFDTGDNNKNTTTKNASSSLFGNNDTAGSSSIFGNDINNSNNNTSMSLFGETETNTNKYNNSKKSYSSIFGTFDDDDNNNNNNSNNNNTLLPPSSPLFGEVTKKKAGNIDLFDRDYNNNGDINGMSNIFGEQQEQDDYVHEHHHGATHMQRLWRGHSGRKEHFSLLLEKHEEEEKIRLEREQQRLEDGYALLDHHKSKQEDHHNEILNRNKNFTEKNLNDPHSNVEYLDVQESDHYSDEFGELLAKKFKRCLVLKAKEDQNSFNLRKAFKQIDSNHDGIISRKEFHEAIDLLDLDFREPEIRVLIAYLDRNNDGDIDLAEFKVFRNVHEEDINEQQENRLRHQVVDVPVDIPNSPETRNAALKIQKTIRGHSGRKEFNQAYASKIEKDALHEQKKVRQLAGDVDTDGESMYDSDRNHQYDEMMYGDEDETKTSPMKDHQIANTTMNIDALKSRLDIAEKRKLQLETESLSNKKLANDLKLKVETLEKKLLATSSTLTSPSNKNTKINDELKLQFDMLNEKHTKLGIKEKQQLVEISNLKQQLATMTDNKDSTNKYEAEAKKHQTEINQMHDEIDNLTKEIETKTNDFNVKLDEKTNEINELNKEHNNIIAAMKHEHQIVNTKYTTQINDHAIKEEKLNLQIEDLNLQLKVEKNKYEVLHKQKNETEETWKLNEEKRINEIKKKTEVETLKTMKEIVQKEADSRNNLTKKQDELIATKKELDLLVQLKDLDVEKRKEVETKNEKLEKENGIMKHELVQLQAKLATLLKKQGQIEQKTKDDIAFQALHHRVEQEKVKLMLLQHRNKKIADHTMDDNLRPLSYISSKKSNDTRQGEETRRNNVPVGGEKQSVSALPPKEVYRPLKSLSIAEVGVLLRHYDLTLFIDKFRKHNIDGRELSEFQFEEDLMPFHVGRRTQHMKLLHLISELITIGVNDKLFIELKRHNARIKRLTNRMRTPAGPISQMSVKARFQATRVGGSTSSRRLSLSPKGTNKGKGINKRKGMHHPKGNKIIRSGGRNFHLNINDNDEYTSNDYDDDNDDLDRLDGLENNSGFIFTNGIMIEPRNGSKKTYRNGGINNHFHRSRGDRNPIEFV